MENTQSGSSDSGSDSVIHYDTDSSITGPQMEQDPMDSDMEWSSMDSDMECSSVDSQLDESPVSVTEYFERGPGVSVSSERYVPSFDGVCVFGNHVRMTNRNAYQLAFIAGGRRMDIPYYVCTMEKVFVPPQSRMHLSAHFTSTYMLEFTDQSTIPIKIKIGRVCTKDTVDLKLSSDNLLTFASNWSRFASTELQEGQICAFTFKVKWSLLRIRMDLL